MNKIKIAVCIQDSEYKKRFVNCLMNHYRNQLELHLFTGENELAMAKAEGFCALLLSDGVSPGQEFDQIPKLYLTEEPVSEEEKRQEESWYIDKYQPVNRIVEELLSHIGSMEACQLQENGQIVRGSRLTGIYSLSESKYQIPYALTYGSIVSERESVLLLDLQENSGLSEVFAEENAMGLEELLIMAGNGKYSTAKMLSCIGHIGHVDLVYPAVNTECLCEATAETYSRLLGILTQELDYREIIINFGSRFLGFFELMGLCDQVCLLQRSGGGGLWREKEFLQELQRKDTLQISEHMKRVELPPGGQSAASFERLTEQWKWSELGDLIRKERPGVLYAG